MDSLDFLSIDLDSPTSPSSSPQPRPVQNLQSILTLIERQLASNQSINEFNKTHLLNKLNQMNEEAPVEEEKERLFAFVKQMFEVACKNFNSSRHVRDVEHLIEILGLIVNSYTVENFSVKLWNQFLQMDVRIFNDIDLNILLMSKSIISITEWDRQLASYFKKEAAELPESELQFFSNILEKTIVEKKILVKEQVPRLIGVIESMSQDRKIGKFCQFILDTINQKKPAQPSGADITASKMKDFFIKWVVVSYIDDKVNQKEQIDSLFIELRNMGIDSDPKMFLTQLKVMVKYAIEKSLFYGDDSGERRPADRLDLRYIDSFV